MFANVLWCTQLFSEFFVYFLCNMSLPLLYPLTLFTKQNLTWGNSYSWLIYDCSLMSAFCQFLSDKSITSYPPSFSGEVLRDTFKAKDRFTVRIGSENNRLGTWQQPVIECQSDVCAVSQKLQTTSGPVQMLESCDWYRKGEILTMTDVWIHTDSNSHHMSLCSN